MKRSRPEKSPTGNASLVTMMAGAEADNEEVGRLKTANGPGAVGWSRCLDSGWLL